MKKVYFILLLCCTVTLAKATNWYGIVGGDVTNVNNWYSTIIGGTHPTVPDFLAPGNTWYVTSAMTIGPGLTWNIGGTVYIGNGQQINKSTGAGTTTINIGQDLIITDNAKITSSPLSSGGTELYLKGDLHVFPTGYINSLTFTGLTTSNTTTVHFADLGATLATPKKIIWRSVNDTAKNKFTAFVVETGSVRKIDSSSINLPMYSTAGFTVKGTLICDTFTINSQGLSPFVISDGANLFTAHPGGIDKSIDTMSTKTYSAKANYFYNGTAAQVTGTTLPANFLTGGSVTTTNNAGVTLSQPTTFDVSSFVNLNKGLFRLGGNLTMLNGSGVNVDFGNFDSNPIYNSLVNVTYTDIMDSAVNVTTGNELLPVATFTSIGKVEVNKRQPSATVTLGSAFTANGDVVLTTGALDCGFPAGRNITANANWVNNFGTVNFFPRNNTVTLNGTALQHIGGSSTTKFDNVLLNNSAGAVLDIKTLVNKTLTLTLGNLYVTTNDLEFTTAASAIAPGTFSSSNMIIANTANHVIKRFTLVTGSFFFPVGDSSIYSPISLALTATSFGSSAGLQVNVTPLKHPNNANVNHYLERYWSVNMLGIMSSPKYIANAYYDVSDVFGTEANMAAGEYHFVPTWRKYGLTDVGLHKLTTGQISDPNAAITGITAADPTVSISADTRICRPAGAAPISVLSFSGDPLLTYSWSPASGLSSTTTTSVVATPSVTTTYTVTITDGNGFTGTATTAVIVDSVPALLTGATTNSPICIGDTLKLTAGTPTHISTYSWTGPTTITSGGIAANEFISPSTLGATGVYTVYVTNGLDSGCQATYTTPAAIINPLPNLVTITSMGGLVACDTTTIVAALAGPGTIYYQGTVSNGTSTTDAFSSILISASGTYHFRAQNTAGCWGPDDSITITINPLPLQYNVSGGGAFCAGDSGVHVGLDGSDTVKKYYLYLAGVATGDSLVGTGAALDWGLRTASGVYTVKAKDTVTGCVNDMLGNAIIIINPLPDTFSMNGSGGYCLGGTGYTVGLIGSQFGIGYDLYYLDTATGSSYVCLTCGGGTVYGGGTGFDFGAYTAVGNYKVIATNPTTGCTKEMPTIDSVWIYPLPKIHNLLPNGGQMCAGDIGFDLILDSSEITVNYSLWNGSLGAPLPGTGADVNFGYQTVAGEYIVIATEAHGIYVCTDTMSGIDTIIVNPLPAVYMVTGSGSYCILDTIPYTIGLGGSDLGIRYTLYYAGSPILSDVDGDGSPLAFGSYVNTGAYSVIAKDTTTGCLNSMAPDAVITANPLPVVFNLLGGGHYCAGGTGVDITMSATELDVVYTLVDSATGFAVATASSTGDFGFITAAGSYYATAQFSTTGCQDTMSGIVHVVIDPLPTVYNMTGGGYFCTNDTLAFGVGTDGSDTGINYQVYRDGTPIGSPVPGTGGPLAFGSTVITGTYTVVATNIWTGCVSNIAGSSIVMAAPAPTRFNLTGGGRYCEGTGGPSDTLSGSEVGVNYQLYRDGVLFGSVFPGTGSPINFGALDSNGVYTVRATNPSTFCNDTMNGYTFVTILPIPRLFTIAGGGSYCLGDSGLHVYLSGSLVGTNYELYNGTTLVTTKPGTGFGLDFGLYATTGTYSCIANLPSDSCTRNMVGAVTISINALPPTHTITGGGSYCAGGVGDSIGLNGSDIGIQYQLFNGTTPSGIAVDGTGSAISFGTRTAAGTYQVKAIDLATGCGRLMLGVVTISINPLPVVYAVTGGGSYCAGDGGLAIGLANSELGINYQLRLGTSAVGGPVSGTGSAIGLGIIPSAGTYYVTALNTTTGCADTMAGTAHIIVNPTPALFHVTGGGVYCAGDTGVHVGLSGSSAGVRYQLYAGNLGSGTPKSGTGSALDFGLRTADSTYSVIATDTTTGCTARMLDTAVITIQPFAVPTVTLAANPGTSISVGQTDTVTATVTGAGGTPTYRWRINRNPVPGATSNTLVFVMYFDDDTIDCDVTSVGLCGGIVTTKQIIIHLKVPSSVKQIVGNSNNIRLMPNPNKGNFDLKGSLGTGADEELYVEVVNMLGQTIYTNKIMARNGEVDEHLQLNGNLANGMYLLNLRSGTVNSVYHFVIEQ